MKKFTMPFLFLFLFLLFLLSGCNDKPVTQVYLPVASEKQTDTAVPSESSSSRVASDSASHGMASSETTSKVPVASKSSFVASSKAETSSVDSSKAEKEARKALLQEKKKEKEALELMQKGIEDTLDSDISEVKSKIMDCETKIEKIDADLRQSEETLDKVVMIPDDSTRVEDILKQTIAELEEQKAPLQKELEDLNQEKADLEERLKTARTEYQKAILLISTEILALS